MRDFINSIDIWKVIIIYLLILHFGNYSQLFFSGKKKLRDYVNYNLRKPFYILYWIATIIACIMTVFLVVLVIWKVVN